MGDRLPDWLKVETNPTFVGSYDTPSCAHGVAINGNMAYVADSDSLQIIDVTNPASPVCKGSYAYTWCCTWSSNKR